VIRGSVALVAHDDTTDKLFPPPEQTGVIERPIPIGPSIRMEFLAHRRHIDGEIAAWRGELAAALERFAPEPSPVSAMKRVGRGAALGGKYGAAILAGLGLVQALVKAYRPDLAGPFDGLIQVLGG
jgi:hypothetical protein